MAAPHFHYNEQTVDIYDIIGIESDCRDKFQQKQNTSFKALLVAKISVCSLLNQTCVRNSRCNIQLNVYHKNESAAGSANRNKPHSLYFILQTTDFMK